jgi:SAM-dependent methyltransferase
MGRSDPIVLKRYFSSIPDIFIESAAFLGFQSSNELTRAIKSKNKDFYDIDEKSGASYWNINDKDWKIDKEKYDLVVCTRCAYFAKDPERFILQCKEILKPGGFLLVDWGLGDHWRFENYKIGWVKDGEHEYAYSKENFLWSTIWHDTFSSNIDVENFTKNVSKFGYTDIKTAIEKEVPSILSLNHVAKSFDSITYSILNLWEDSPQLYIILLCKKSP